MEATLTPLQKSNVGDEVRSCLLHYNNGRGKPGTFVLIKVITDATGTVQLAEVAPTDQARVLADPALRLLAEHAVRALLDRRCAALPLPDSLRNAPHSFEFRVSP
jgi:hypothetical protein